MPRHSTIPTLYDDAKYVSLTELKKWGYLKPQQTLSGVITWRRSGNITGRISIEANTLGKVPFIVLDYKYGDEPRNYKVQFVSVPSNLGKGYIWYFLCPHTNKRCRKLYSVDGWFFHREAFKGCYYEKQTYSKNNRSKFKRLEPYFQMDDTQAQLNSKYFKNFYAGKPTKRFKKLMNKLRAASNTPVYEIERLFQK